VSGVETEILFLSHRIPFPPDKGDKIRAHALLAHLARHHIVHLAAFVDDPADFIHAGALAELVKGEILLQPLSRKKGLARGMLRLASGGSVTEGYFAAAPIARWVDRLLASRPIARAFVFSSAMAPYLMDRRDFDPASSVLDLVDVDSDKWRQYAPAASWPKNWIYRREAATLAALERRAAAQFGATLLVSPYEAQTFAALAPESADRIHSVGNGVDLSRFAPGGAFVRPFPESEIGIVMTGAMDYWPNAEGAAWFAAEIMPLVLEKLPNARFYIVGANPAPALKALRHAHTVVTGRVADVRPYLAHAAAAVAPLRIARGVQNKVLEAMAMQKPVVATWEATRALNVRPGQDLWVENEPIRFAEAVVAAVQGSARDRVAANGRAYVMRNHDWATSFEALDRVIESLPAARAGTIAEHSRTMAFIAGEAGAGAE
jgi:sugar transferase (PEP-CTERM/EpsH1 system associated)